MLAWVLTEALSTVRNTPVDSTTYRAPESPHGISAGFILVQMNREREREREKEDRQRERKDTGRERETEGSKQIKNTQKLMTGTDYNPSY